MASCWSVLVAFFGCDVHFIAYLKEVALEVIDFNDKNVVFVFEGVVVNAVSELDATIRHITLRGFGRGRVIRLLTVLAGHAPAQHTLPYQCFASSMS